MYGANCGDYSVVINLSRQVYLTLYHSEVPNTGAINWATIYNLVTHKY